jgi:MYXO-CTERM domain-containing protein
MSGGDYGDTRLRDLTTAPGPAERSSAVLVLAALALVGLVGARRRRPEIAAAAAIGLVMCAALAWEVAVTPLRATNTLGYFLWWDSIAGMWVWLALGWSAVALVAAGVRLPVRTPAIASIAAVAVVAGAGVAAAAVQKPDTHEPYYNATRLLAAGLNRAIPPGTSVHLVQRGGPMVAIEPTMRYTLRRHGVRALGPYASHRPGAWYELDHRRYRFVASVNADRPPHYHPARIVARAQMTDARGRHSLTATLSPASAQSDRSIRKNAHTARAADIPGWPNPPGHS